MGLISYSNISDGSTIDASDVNTPFNTIYNDYNGGITAANLASNAVTTVKITDANITPAKWTNPYKFNAYLTAAQNVGTAATLVQFNVKNFDTNSNFDIATNKGRYTAPVAGFYHFNTNILSSTAGAGTAISLYFYKNGSSVLGPNNVWAAAGQNPSATMSVELQLSASDYVEVYAGSAVAAKALDVSTNFANTFSGYLVSPT